MTRKQQVPLAQMKVGILVIIALMVVTAVILQRSWGIQWLSKSEKLITYLPNVAGLKPGAPVWLAGIEIGKVREVNIVPPEIYEGNEPVFRSIAAVKKQLESVDASDPRTVRLRSDLTNELRDLKLDLRFVEVKLDIQSEYINRINRDSEVTIESRGLIGESFIDISPGTYGEPPRRQGEFLVIEGVPTTGFRQIMTGANDVIANFGILSDQVKDIALKIKPDQVSSGLSETLNNVQETLRRATQTFDRATLLIEDLRAGQGTIGKMVADPTVYHRLAESLERFNKIAEDIQGGSGTLAKLIKDPGLYDSARETLRKADIVMDRIEKGEGTLGRLSKDEQLYERSRQAIDRFASFVEKVEAGEGTIGKLLKDPALYDNLNLSTAEMTKLIYDLRQDPQKYLTIRFRLF